MEPVHIASKRKARERAIESRRLKFFLYLGACITSLIAIFGSVQYGSFFKVQAITVSPLPSRIEEAELVLLVRDALAKGGAARVFGMDNIISWPSKARIVDLGVPALKELSVSRSLLRRTITMHAVPRERFGIWCATNPETHCFWFDDKDGVLIEETPIPEGQIIPAIFEVPGDLLLLGKKVITLEELGRVKQILQFFSKSEFKAARIEMHRPLEEMHVTLSTGPLVRLSLRLDEKTPLAALSEFFETHAPGTIATIDLTVEQKLYWTKK